MARRTNSLRDLDRERSEEADFVGAFQLLAITVVTCVVFQLGAYVGETRGLGAMAEVAASSIEREEHSRNLLARLYVSSEVALAVVAREDSILRERIRTEVPGWQDIAAITQGYLVDQVEER